MIGFLSIYWGERILSQEMLPLVDLILDGNIVRRHTKDLGQKRNIIMSLLFVLC